MRPLNSIALPVTSTLSRLHVGKRGTSENEQPFGRQWIRIRCVVLDVEATKLARRLEVADHDALDAHDLVGKRRRCPRTLHGRDLLARRAAQPLGGGGGGVNPLFRGFGVTAEKSALLSSVSVLPSCARIAAVVLVRRGRPGAFEEVRVAIADEVDDMRQSIRWAGRRASVAAKGRGDVNERHLPAPAAMAIGVESTKSGVGKASPFAPPASCTRK